jgi:hypothetical protein
MAMTVKFSDLYGDFSVPSTRDETVPDPEERESLAHEPEPIAGKEKSVPIWVGLAIMFIAMVLLSK